MIDQPTYKIGLKRRNATLLDNAGKPPEMWAIYCGLNKNPFPVFTDTKPTLVFRFLRLIHRIKMAL